MSFGVYLIGIDTTVEMFDARVRPYLDGIRIHEVMLADPEELFLYDGEEEDVVGIECSSSVLAALSGGPDLDELVRSSVVFAAQDLFRLYPQEHPNPAAGLADLSELDGPEDDCEEHHCVPYVQKVYSAGVYDAPTVFLIKARYLGIDVIPMHEAPRIVEQTDMENLLLENIDYGVLAAEERQMGKKGSAARIKTVMEAVKVCTYGELVDFYRYSAKSRTHLEPEQVLSLKRGIGRSTAQLLVHHLRRRGINL